MCTLSKAQTMGTEKPTFSSIPIIFTLLFCAVTLVNAEIHMITKPIIATSANIRTTAPFIDIINKNIQPPQSVSIIEYRNKHAIGAGKIDLSSPNIYLYPPKYILYPSMSIKSSILNNRYETRENNKLIHCYYSACDNKLYSFDIYSLVNVKLTQILSDFSDEAIVHRSQCKDHQLCVNEEITCKKSFIINELFNGKTNHQIVFNVIIIKMLHCIGKSINIIPMMDKYLINQNGGNNVSDTLFVPITFVGLRRF
eukprot:374023_1